MRYYKTLIFASKQDKDLEVLFLDIHIKNLVMEFNKNRAIDNMSATIKDGELVSLLGPSGCGKSTTLMLLAGLYKPTSGQILFGDEDVTNVEAEDRGIGMVFQNYALYPHLSVLKNIMFPLKMQKIPKEEAKKRALEVAQLVEIDHLIDRKPGQLSGGQQQRVAIARALVKKPKVLLLDEPLSNLDARLRLEMREEIRRIQLEVGITAIFVTHDQEEAMSISDRVMLMHGGIIQQESKPQEMYKKPVNEFVAKFIGSPPINMIEHDGYKVGMRPEDLYLTDSNDGIVSGELIHLETIGRDTLIKVKSGENMLRALVGADTVVAIGDKVNLGIKEADKHYFDLTTGERVERREDS